MINTPTPHKLGPLVVALAVSCTSFATEIRVEISRSRTPGAIEAATDDAARDFAKHASALSSGLTHSLRRAGILQGKLAIPTRVVLTDRGRDLPFKGREAGDIQPTFDTSGTRVFEQTYKEYLQRVFTAARPVMNTVFGKPAVGGPVRIRNYDADIQDRYAVGGGYYVPNGANGPEIRFPIYNNKVSAGVNYVHTLMLAYMANKQYPWDAYNEGLVRAATMIVCRTPGALPDSPDPDQIEAALTSLYDVGSFYDWYNNVGIGGPRFIAPNLLNTKLPIGGSTGGIFLLRYQMAGTTWAKVALRYPGFIAEFNKRYYLNPSLYQTTAELEALAQLSLNTVSGTANTKIEGLSFSDWAQRQAILDTRLTPGLKLVLNPVPLFGQAGTTDFGVFDIVLNAFQTAANGDEVLLSGSSFPIFWRPDYTRFFASAQDDVIRIAGAYGSVTPNFLGDTFGGKPYRVVVDVPWLGKVARTTLPAGAFSTGDNPDPNTFYGSLLGFDDPGAIPYKVNVSWVGGSKVGIPVTNFAFGFNITDANYLNSGPITIRVLQGANEVLRREVVKSVGSIAVNLTPTTTETSYSLSRAAKLEMKGLPLEPYRPNPADILGLSDADTLFGRWNSNLGRYDLYPSEGEFRSGLGYWLRPPSAATRIVKGRSVPNTPIAVSLSPGWNQVTVPFNSVTPTTNVLVTVSTEAVGTYAEAVADGTLGTTIFQYVPSAGNPDSGSTTPASNFEPGKAYFVRVNRAEGAVLIFVPPGGANKPNTRGRDKPVYHRSWEFKVTLMDRPGKTSPVTIGQAYGATRNFDPALDSDFPPLMPGFQLAVRNRSLMFKDIRQALTDETFELELTGLNKGEKYALRFQPVLGTKQLRLTDRGVSQGISSNYDYTFTATGATMRMTLFTAGSR